MASHYALPIRPRSLANVLSDLKEAHDDAIQAQSDGDDDRFGEAETRVDDLRDEFAERFVETTGLTWKQIEAAISEAVL
jgi:phosphate uptake regulator